MDILAILDAQKDGYSCFLMPKTANAKKLIPPLWENDTKPRF